MSRNERIKPKHELEEPKKKQKLKVAFGVIFILGIIGHLSGIFGLIADFSYVKKIIQREVDYYPNRLNLKKLNTAEAQFNNEIENIYHWYLIDKSDSNNPGRLKSTDSYSQFSELITENAYPVTKRKLNEDIICEINSLIVAFLVEDLYKNVEREGDRRFLVDWIGESHPIGVEQNGTFFSSKKDLNYESLDSIISKVCEISNNKEKTNFLNLFQRIHDGMSYFSKEKIDKSYYNINIITDLCDDASLDDIKYWVDLEKVVEMICVTKFNVNINILLFPLTGKHESDENKNKVKKLNLLLNNNCERFKIYNVLDLASKKSDAPVEFLMYLKSIDAPLIDTKIYNGACESYDCSLSFFYDSGGLKKSKAILINDISKFSDNIQIILQTTDGSEGRTLLTCSPSFDNSSPKSMKVDSPIYFEKFAGEQELIFSDLKTTSPIPGLAIEYFEEEGHRKFLIHFLFEPK